MKLKNWLRKENSNHIYRWWNIWPANIKGLHVIGTCNHCGGREECGIIQAIYEEGGIGGPELEEEFGCIHFEVKEGEK